MPTVILRRYWQAALALLTLAVAVPAHATWVATPWNAVSGTTFVLRYDGTSVLAGGETFYSGTITRRGLVRLSGSDWTLDPAFTPDVTYGTGPSATAGEVHAITVQSDSKIVIGGRFDHVNGVARNNIARLNADGTLDGAYDPNVTVTSGNGVEALMVQPDDKLLVGGYFSQVGTTARYYLARLDTNGALDATFADPALDNGVRAIALQPGGEVLIGGMFNQAGGQPRDSVARLNANGTLDAAFGDPGVTGWVNAMYLQGDGKLLIGGLLTQVDGQPRTGLARLNADGSIDNTLSVDANESIYAFRPRGGGSSAMVIAGAFDQVGGAPHQRVASIDIAANTVQAAFNDVGVVNAGFVAYAVLPLSPQKVLFGGWFARVDQQPRNGLAIIQDLPGVPPAAPTITQALPGNGQVTLTITPPIPPGPDPITGYDVACTPFGPGGSVTAANTPSPATLIGMTNDTPYACSARAVNANGAGPASEQVFFSPALTPTAPAATAVPTLSGWALALLALACAALGVRRMRRN
ncbi:delta-60 repeat domain-containing protein [Comamonas humi]